MNFGGVMHVVSMMYQTAKDFCGGEYEITVRSTGEDDILTFYLRWLPVDGKYMKHYAAALTDGMSFHDAMFVAQTMKRHIAEHYSQPAFPEPRE